MRNSLILKYFLENNLLYIPLFSWAKNAMLPKILEIINDQMY